MIHLPILGLMEAFDRNGGLLARAPVMRWPVTVGRGLGCDLVLDDPYVAAAHLRIDRPVGGRGHVSVEVLESVNGVALHRKRYQGGDRLDWPNGTLLEIGRTRVSLRLADSAIADEQPLPQFPWRALAATAALLAATLAVVVGLAWLQAADASKFLQSLPGLLLLAVLSLGLWSGLWAVANKVFAGQLQFWRHVRIACATFLAVEAVQGVANLAAFMFSWESLARFDHVLAALVTAVGIYAHLAAVLPRRRVGLAIAVAAVMVVGVPALLGSQWLDRKRLASELYMSSFFPPGLRVAPAVPVPQFLEEAGSLRGRLDRRLHSDDDAQPADGEASEGDGDGE